MFILSLKGFAAASAACGLALAAGRFWSYAAYWAAPGLSSS
jgi:hypothetical protein